jgi:hypothetical protein
MSHDTAFLLTGMGAGIAAGAALTFLLMRARAEVRPRTRDELLHRAQEYNLRALRAPAA